MKVIYAQLFFHGENTGPNVYKYGLQTHKTFLTENE